LICAIFALLYWFSFTSKIPVTKEPQIMSRTIQHQRTISRRQFGKSALAAAAGSLAAPAILRGANLNSKLNIAVLGAAGRGADDAKSLASENIVAICDVNARSLAAAGQKYPGAKLIEDYRTLFDQPDGFDAVAIAIPEHSHSLPTMLALQHDKHIYSEKPLTHDGWEARTIREAAAKKPRLITAMGIQMHATDNYRQIVAIIQGGAIGPVREAHVWVSRAWGLQSEEASKRNKDITYVTDRPTEIEQPPEWLNFDLWLGPAAQRPYSHVYFPGPKWYRWWDFGNGTMSDLGSHWNDLPYWALKLHAPLTIEGFGPPPHPEIAPASMTAVYEYGPRGDMPPVTLSWHQGEDKPQIWKAGGIPQWPDGAVFIGDKGILLANYSKYVLLPEKDFADYVAPPMELGHSPGHHKEWIEAVKSGKPMHANFEYAGWLTEANHLGNVAYRVGKKLMWDANAMCATNAPEADQYLRRPRRKGWELV
jgi:predicted dehydrogenase